MKAHLIKVTGKATGETGYFKKLKDACEWSDLNYNTVTSYFRRMNNKGTPNKTYMSKTGVTLTKTTLI